MKSTILAASLLLACGSTSAKVTPENMSAIGEWSGRGETVGQPFTACAVFSPYMDGIYLHLDYSVQYDNPGSLPDMTSEFFYYFLDDGKIEGASLDSQSNVFQLSGSHDAKTATLQWLKNGNIVGKSEWRQSADGKTLSLKRFGQLESGELKEIGEVLLKKMPAGQICKKK
jgi:hypothetical protein